MVTTAIQFSRARRPTTKRSNHDEAALQTMRFLDALNLSNANDRHQRMAGEEYPCQKRELPPFRCMALFAVRFFATCDSAFRSLDRNTVSSMLRGIRLRPELCDDKSNVDATADEPEDLAVPHRRRL